MKKVEMEDPGDPDANVKLVKELLAGRIINTLDKQKLNYQKAFKKTGVDQPDFSRIGNVNLKRFTIDRLIKILNKLDPKIEITVKFKGRRGKSG